MVNEIIFPDDDHYVNLPAGARLQVEDAEGTIKTLVLTHTVRVRLVPEEGTQAVFQEETRN